MKNKMMMPYLTRPTPLLAALGLLAATVAESQAVLFSYYIGVDGQQTIPTGAYAGLANPNANRLTLLFAHPNEASPSSGHYHSKGVYRYQPGSPVGSPVIEVNPANYLPEGSAAPLSMTAGVGIYAGKSVVLEDSSNGFSLIDFRDTDDLAAYAPGTAESYMYNSSGGRWTGSIAGADVHLVLVWKSDGLNIGNDSSLNIGLNGAGDEYHLSDDVNFSPVFWTEQDAVPGTYLAQFKLVDEEGIFGDSGTFEFRFDVVPEPSSALLAAGAAALGLMRRRR
ncbi:MAG: PEP-CTERM sorting domain-containing protein [Akkermansiaceae bacterium]|nr:PEP-CTERM sorting domain-containing protein [Akkermansiaceae bacterium]